jgi:hypothetical protein
VPYYEIFPISVGMVSSAVLDIVGSLELPVMKAYGLHTYFFSGTDSWLLFVPVGDNHLPVFCDAR